MATKDIEVREDIQKIVDAFYTKVQQDVNIGPFFNEVAHVDWSKHLPKMYDFWEFLVLGTGSYKGNVAVPHLDLNKKKTLEPPHFDAWLALFNGTVDELFAGPRAEEMKSRAHTIAWTLRHKIDSLNH